MTNTLPKQPTHLSSFKINKNFQPQISPFTPSIHKDNLSTQNLTQPSTPLPTTKEKNPLTQKLSIASLNTRDLNNETKFKCLLDYIQRNEYSIFGLSETKLKESTKKYSSNNSSIIHWSFNDSSQAEVALVMDPNLYNHHLKTESFKGYVISAYFNFKLKTTLCITQLYIPHDPPNKKLTLQYLKNLIQLNNNSNNPHILMGNFNTTPIPL